MADSVPEKHLTGKTDKNILYCDPCFEDGDKKPAAGFCVECQHYLCDQCYQCHCVPRPMRHHKLLGKSEMPKKSVDDSLSEICTQHEGEVIKYYCKTHKTFGCNSCMITDHRQCLGVSTLTDMAKDVEQSTPYKEFCMRMDTLKTKLEGQIRTAKENIAITKSYKEAAISNINDLQEEINKQFESLKQHIVKEAEEKEAKAIRKIQEVEDSANNAKDALDHLKEDFQILEETKQSKQLFIALNKSQEKLQKLEQELEDIQKENKEEQYAFVPNTFLTSMLKNIDALGELCVQGEEETDEEQKEIYGNYPEYGMLRGSPISENMVVTLDTIYNSVRVYKRTQDFFSLAVVTEKVLSSCPWDIATVSEDKFVVTMPNEKKIKIMSVENGNITENKDISLDARCEGIDCNEDQLFVACSKPAQVLVLDMTGTILQNISMDQEGKPLFKQPAYLRFHEKNQLICVSDRKASCVVALTTEGNVQYVFRDEKLKMPVTIFSTADELVSSDFEIMQTFKIDLSTGEFKVDDENDENDEKNMFAFSKTFHNKTFMSAIGFINKEVVSL